MTASQRAKQKCATKQNKSTTTSNAADCCCMVAPWVVTEEGRSYQLKVTKVGKEPGLNNTEIDVSKKLEPSNKENGKYELHIVAPPAKKDGTVNYKTITSKHKFIKKECDLKMLVKGEKQEKSISEGGSFEIDTNGNIKGALGKKCEEDKQDPTATTTPTFQQPVGKDACITGPQKQNSSSTPSYMDITSLNDRYGSAGQKDMTKAEKEAFAQELKSYMNTLKDEDETAESDLVVLFKALTDPNSLAKKFTLFPIGSSKCKMNPKVELWVVEPLVIEGEITLDYKPQHTVYEYKKKSWDAIANAQLSIEGKVVVEKGSTAVEYSTGYTSGFNKDGDTTHTKMRRKHAKRLFGGMHKPINDFYKLFGSNPHKSKGGAWSFNAGITQLYIKATNVTLAENPNNYDLDWEGKFDLGITLFKDMHGKFDIINAILAKGSDTISAFVEEVRTRVKKGYDSKHFAASAEVEANFVISGSVEGTCTWDKKVAQAVKPDGEIVGTIGLALEAKIEGKTRVFELKAKAGAELKTTSAKDTNAPPSIKATLEAKAGKNNAIDFDGDVLCTGVAIYYGFYAEANWSKDKEIEQETSSGFPEQDNSPVKSVTEGHKLEETGDHVLVDEFSISEAFFGKKQKDTK